MKLSNYARAVAAIGAAGTIAGLLLWAAAPSPGAPGPRLIVAGVFSLPLLFALIGLLRGRVYTAAWAAMLAVLYMAYALMEYIVLGGSTALWLTLLSSSALFTGSALYPRLRSREGTSHKPGK